MDQCFSKKSNLYASKKEHFCFEVLFFYSKKMRLIFFSKYD